MSTSQREIKSSRPKALAFIVIATAIIILLVAKFVFIDKSKTPDSDQYAWEEKLDSFKENAAPPAPARSEKQGDTAPSPSAEAPAPVQTECERLNEAAHDFFSHLDEQEYIKAYEMGEPARETINKIIITLLNNPPIISQETEDLFTVLKNTAHFYRILGHKDLSFLKDILSYEQNDLEHLLAVFYKIYITPEDCPQAPGQITMPIRKTYEYAAFFLHTLGGQSYLFRRESRLRTLTKYYCMLILDTASQENRNTYEIDEIDTLDSVIKELQEADSLENQETYLKELASIRARILQQ